MSESNNPAICIVTKGEVADNNYRKNPYLMDDRNHTRPSKDLTAIPCQDVRDELHSLLMDELSDDESGPILSHLAECKECRLALTQHSKLLGHLVTYFPGLNVSSESRGN